MDERLKDQAEGAAASLEEKDLVDKGLLSLDPGKRDLLRLRFLEGKRFKEIERELELTRGKCRRGIHRGLEAARVTLEAGGLPSATGRMTRQPRKRGAY